MNALLVQLVDDWYGCDEMNETGRFPRSEPLITVPNATIQPSKALFQWSHCLAVVVCLPCKGLMIKLRSHVENSSVTAETHPKVLGPVLSYKRYIIPGTEYSQQIIERLLS